MAVASPLSSVDLQQTLKYNLKTKHDTTGAKHFEARSFSVDETVSDNSIVYIVTAYGE